MPVTRNEIVTQPEAWAQALDEAAAHASTWRKHLTEVARVVFTGCGSTYYLSLAAAALFQSLTGREARGVPGSELALYPETVLTREPTALIAVSRSGATSETLRAVEVFRAAARGPVLAITTRANAPLVAQADDALVLTQGQERSVVQTRSFAAMYLAAVALSVHLADWREGLTAMARLPELGRRIIERAEPWAAAQAHPEQITQVFFLGSGSYYGLAAELSLKMKEMSLTPSEPFHTLEFRHGPMSLVTPQTMLVGLVDERHARYTRALLDEMQRLGARVLRIAEDDAEFPLHAGVPDLVRGVLYLPPLQLLAYEWAVAKGLDPDQPRHLQAVVRLSF
ncbi:MAG: SIS domain-containing protein [Chloroflexi bacterium]|nr:SIS domain-containing protein [Chloroflexota bacterium]